MGPKKTLLLETTAKGLETAGDIVRRGGLVVFPTETVYGLGANALDADACGRIFAAKGRPGDNPLIVHLPDVFALPSAAADISPEAAVLIEAFMPGPLTLILPKSPAIPDRVTAGLATVGLRVPSDPVAREFLRRAGVPVAAPSANISGKPSPTTFEMAWEAMEGRADAVIRGGDCEVGLESTILRAAGGGVEILRPGKIGERDIARLLKMSPSFAEARADGPPPAPGMKYTHYKPRAEVILFTRGEDLAAALAARGGRKIGVLALGTQEAAEVPRDVPVMTAATIEEYARRLYAEFFVFDRLGCDEILAFYPPPDGIGGAVRNRLLKAAGGRFIGKRP